MAIESDLEARAAAQAVATQVYSGARAVIHTESLEESAAQVVAMKIETTDYCQWAATGGRTGSAVAQAVGKGPVD